MFRPIASFCVLLVACGDDADTFPPGLEDVTVTTAEDTPVTVAVPLTAVDAREVTLTIVTAPTHGTLTGLGPSWTYTPAANYSGSDSAVVSVDDLFGTAEASVTINVTPVNDVPSAAADSFAAGFDTPLTIAQTTLLANDSDIDSSMLTVTAVTAGTHGSPAISGGDVVFTPETGFEGTATFTYTVSDGGLTALATVTVAIGADEPPVAVVDAATTDEDVAAIIDDATLLANDTDAENHTLAISAVGAASHGSVSHTGTQVTFVPEQDYHGLASFEYTVTDGYKTSIATVVVSVSSVNDAPVPGADSGTTDEDAPLTVSAASLIANDSDVDGDTVDVSAVAATANTHGAVNLAGGIVTYTPDGDFHGTAAFSYTASDGNGGTATGTVTVTVAPINDNPVAATDTVTVDEDGSLTFAASQLASNDSDVDGDPLTVTAVASTANTHGTVSLVAGSITYTPAANFNGGADFNYTLSDGQGGTATGSVTVTVASINDAPVVTATAGTVTYVENAAALPVDPGIVVADTDHATLSGATIAITTSCTASQDVLALASPPVGITVTGYNAATCTLTLTGAASVANYQAALRLVSYLNTSDAPATTGRTVTFTVDDGALATPTGSDSRDLGVTAVDDAPVAVADSGGTDEDASASSIAVLTNDTDVDGGSKSIASVTQPANGTVVITGGGTGLTYAPNGNYCNTSPAFDTFTYTLSPGGSTATVSVSVTCADDPPVAVDDSATVTEDSVANAINVLANDTDIDAGTNTVASITQPSNGIAAIAGDGLSVTYTPFASYCNQAPNQAQDSFTYTIAPGGTSATVTVAVSCACGKNKPTDFVVGSN